MLVLAMVNCVTPYPGRYDVSIGRLRFIIGITDAVLVG